MKKKKKKSKSKQNQNMKIWKFENLKIWIWKLRNERLIPGGELPVCLSETNKAISLDTSILSRYSLIFWQHFFFLKKKLKIKIKIILKWFVINIEINIVK